MSVQNLFDGDLATISGELGKLYRAGVTVADVTAAYRAELVTRYKLACRSTVWWEPGEIEREAQKFDAAHPDAPSLLAELHATQRDDRYEDEKFDSLFDLIREVA